MPSHRRRRTFGELWRAKIPMSDKRVWKIPCGQLTFISSPRRLADGFDADSSCGVLASWTLRGCGR
jgi:hypothetical protein